METIYEDDTGVKPAGAGRDVTRWLGKRPYYLWEDASERNRFRQILTNEELNCLRTSTANIASEFELYDGYIIASGMWPRQGGSRHGYVALNVQTGRPFAIQMWQGDLHFFGSTEEDFPSALRDWVQKDTDRLNTEFERLFGKRSVDREYVEKCS
jgi:hypothetical protein